MFLIDNPEILLWVDLVFISMDDIALFNLVFRKHFAECC